MKRIFLISLFLMFAMSGCIPVNNPSDNLTNRVDVLEKDIVKLKKKSVSEFAESVGASFRPYSGGLTGGGTGALDKTTGTDNQDAAIVMLNADHGTYPNFFGGYTLNVDGAGTEDVPWLIDSGDAGDEDWNLTTHWMLGGATGDGATGPGWFRFYEDSDNGTDYGRIIGQASLGSDVDYTLPASAGTLALTTAKLDDFGTPDDNTDLNVTTTYHGLIVKLPNDATKIFDGVGSWVDIEDLADEIAAGIAAGELADNTVNSADINTIVTSIMWVGAGMTPDGTQCDAASDVQINSGPFQSTIICADNDASTLYGNVQTPDSWDAGNLVFELAYIQTAADTGALNGDVTIQCRGTGETVNNTWESEVAMDDAAVTGSNAVDQLTSGNVSGTCVAGDTVYWRWQMDATGTDTAVATLHFVGMKMEYTSNVGD